MLLKSLNIPLTNILKWLILCFKLSVSYKEYDLELSV